MIFSLTGKIIHKDDNFLVIEASQIGYQVFVSNKFLKKIKINEKLTIFTHLYQRENYQELFGFATIEELKFFKELLPISGVGPRMAQGLLSLGELKEIKKEIQEGNVSFIKQVKGVGAKNAERIIVEMRGKFEKIFQEKKEPNRKLVNALSKLGYKNYEIRETLQEIPNEVKDLKEQIKSALQILGKK